MLIPATHLLCAVPLFANGGGYLSGIKSTGPFRPVNVDTVEMVSENLDIELKKDAALISITYQLRNPGAAVKVEMGFPCAVAQKLEYTKDSREKPIKSLPQLKDFSLTADGKAVDSKLMLDHAKLPGGRSEQEFGEPGGAVITGWQVVKLPFAAGQTRTVSVSYRNPWYQEVSNVSNDSYSSAPLMRYLFSAAGLWKGPITSGEVTIRATGIKPDDVTLNHAKRFKRSGSQWTWSFTDLEPTLEDDLEILVGDAEWSRTQQSESGPVGSYVARGKSSNYERLQKSGKWVFLSRQYDAVASSSLKSSGDLSYGPENLADFDSEKAWVEGAAGDGVGESVTLTMKKPVNASRILIRNGYGKHEDLFLKNNRVRKLGVSVNGGESFSVELPDSFDVHSPIDLPKGAGPLKTVKLTIESVYRGTKFRDTCISDVDIEVPLSKAPDIHPAR